MKPSPSGMATNCPVVIRDPQGALEIDATHRFLVDLRKPEGQSVVH
ncbi:MAG: hypothetical protein ACE5EH_12700 [Gammaproteobacteria bacterium]